GDAVGRAELPRAAALLAELPDELALRVEHEHAVVAAVQDVEVVTRVERDLRDVAQRLPVRAFQRADGEQRLRLALEHAVARGDLDGLLGEAGGGGEQREDGQRRQVYPAHGQSSA